jgi:hypothetical protein
MRKRSRYIVALFLVLCALVIAFFLARKFPPEVTRLLPEADAILFVNLKPIRAATHFDRSPVPPSPAYQQFIQDTGIVAERDLDQAAFALHHMPDPYGPNGPVAFSEVFRGRFNSDRLARYLAGQSRSQESYAGHTIFCIPSDDRTLRVTLLDGNTVAASNAPTPEQLHSIIDRTRSAANPFAGPSLLSAHYADVPPFAVAWGMGQLGLPWSGSGRIMLAGLELPIAAQATFVASLRFTTALQLRIDEITPDALTAARSAQSLSNLLTLFRALPQPQPPNPAMKQFLDSISIQPGKDRATLTATVPAEALKQMTSAGP